MEQGVDVRCVRTGDTRSSCSHEYDNNWESYLLCALNLEPTVWYARVTCDLNDKVRQKH